MFSICSLFLGVILFQQPERLAGFVSPPRDANQLLTVVRNGRIVGDDEYLLRSIWNKSAYPFDLFLVKVLISLIEDYQFPLFYLRSSIYHAYANQRLLTSRTLVDEPYLVTGWLNQKFDRVWQKRLNGVRNVDIYHAFVRDLVVNCLEMLFQVGE